MAISMQQNPTYENRKQFRELAEKVRMRLARYAGAEPDEIALVRNTSEANSTIVNGLALRAGDEIILSEDNHRSNSANWEMRANREGLKIVRSPVPIHARSFDEIYQSLIRFVTDKTRVIALSHLTNTTGLYYPVKQLSDFTRPRKIWLHVDGVQTLGWEDLNLHQLGCDSFAASTHKWMMGPMEAGILFVRREGLDRVEPIIMGVDQWHNHGTALIGARKYEEVGQREDSRLAGIEEDLNILERIGKKQIEERVKTLNHYTRDRLLAISGVTILGTDQRSLTGPIMRAQWPGSSKKYSPGKGPTAEAVQQTLWKRHKVSLTAGDLGLRFSSHIYNNREEIDHVADLLEAIINA